VYAYWLVGGCRLDRRSKPDERSLADRPWGSGTSLDRIIEMALQPLTPVELAETRTLFASFMGHTDESYLTLGQLRATYRERSPELSVSDDRDDDLRVERFKRDMASGRWRDDVVMRIAVYDDTTLIVDGIHRGIAYLSCVEEGLAPERLPALHVER
jgi:hypothetical protein